MSLSDAWCSQFDAASVLSEVSWKAGNWPVNRAGKNYIFLERKKIMFLVVQLFYIKEIF